MSEKKTESIENLHVEKSSALAWKTMHEVSNRKSSPRLSKIEGSSKTERIQSWYNHFKNFLGKENPDAPYLSSTFFNHKISDPLPINTSQFTLEELQTCLAKMSKQKTSDPDNIPTMLWKDHNFRTELLYFCNETERNKVSVFSKSNIITILRKGDLSQTLNYRSITLTSITSKVYSSLLVNCISKHLEPILRRNQNGFHKGRSTLPQILGLTKIIEEIKIASRKASVVFADFSKAFDSINKGAMLHVLHHYGLPDKTIAGIKTMYDNPETFVLSPDGATDSFFTTTGILQGDTLAPYLFMIVVDYILHISLDPINNHGLPLRE